MKNVFLTSVKVLDGTYYGKWGGHILRFKYLDLDVHYETNLGVRGLDVKVSFEVRKNKVIEDSIKTY